MTNREWLFNQMQNMSDEELVKFDIRGFICQQPKGHTCLIGWCDNCRINWLKSEHKEPITLSEAERIILENIYKDYKWICRDIDGELKIYVEKPIKKSACWCWSKDCMTYKYITPFNHLFQFITWNDSEPYNIEELLKGE